MCSSSSKLIEFGQIGLNPGHFINIDQNWATTVGSLGFGDKDTNVDHQPLIDTWPTNTHLRLMPTLPKPNSLLSTLTSVTRFTISNRPQLPFHPLQPSHRHHPTHHPKPNTTTDLPILHLTLSTRVLHSKNPYSSICPNTIFKKKKEGKKESPGLVCRPGSMPTTVTPDSTPASSGGACSSS